MACLTRAMMSFLALSAAAAVAADIPLAIDATYSGRGIYRYCPSVVDSDGLAVSDSLSEGWVRMGSDCVVKHLGEFSAGRLAAAQWEMMDRIYPDDLAVDFSSSFRIHNSGLVRNVRGELSEKTVFVSVAHLENNALYTYRFVPVRWESGTDCSEGTCVTIE